MKRNDKILYSCLGITGLAVALGMAGALVAIWIDGKLGLKLIQSAVVIGIPFFFTAGFFVELENQKEREEEDDEE